MATRCSQRRSRSKTLNRRRRSNRRHFFETLERRQLLAAVVWDGGGDGATWSDPLNWNADQLPGAGDAVFIRSAGGPRSLAYDGTSSSIGSLQSEVPIELTGGSLSVSGQATAAGLSLQSTSAELVGGQWIVDSLVWNAANLTKVDLTVTQEMVWQHTSISGRTLDADSILTIGPNASAVLDSGDSPLLSGLVNVLGTLMVKENVIAASGGSKLGSIDVTSSGRVIFAGPQHQILPTLNNDGVIQIGGGEVELLGGSSPGEADDGRYELADAVLRLASTSQSRTFSNQSAISGTGTLVIDANTSSVTLASQVNDFSGNVVVEAGSLELVSSTQLRSVTLDGGQLGGVATVAVLDWLDGSTAGDVSVVNTLGLPDQSGSRRSINGTLTLGPDSVSVWNGTRALQMGVDATFNVAGALDLETAAALTASTGATVNVTPTGRLRKRSGGRQPISPVINNRGVVQIDANEELQLQRGLSQTDGRTIVDGRLSVSNAFVPIAIDAGQLSGGGTIAGNITVGGTIRPGGNVPGSLTINGDTTLTETATLETQLGGPSSADIDHLVVTGDLSLNGNVDVSLTEGFQPSIGQFFEVLKFASSDGDFQTEIGAAVNDEIKLRREFSADAMNWIAEANDDVNVEAVRQHWLDGLAALREALPQWMGTFDLSDKLVDAIPNELATLFNLPSVIRELTDRLLTMDELAGETIEALTSEINTALSPFGQVTRVGGDDGNVFEAELTITSDLLQANVNINSIPNERLRHSFELLGVEGQAELDATTAIEIRFGVDGGGFFVDTASHIRLDVGMDATATGRLSLFDAVLDGQGDLNAAVPFTSLDVDSDNQLRLGEISRTDWANVLATEVLSGQGALAVNLRSPTLSFVDVDGLSTNNTAQGGDVFQFSFSNGIELEDGQLTWRNWDVAGGDFDGDGDEDFTTEILAENTRRLLLDQLGDDSSDIVPWLTSAISSHPGIAFLNQQERLAEVLGFEAAITSAVIDAIRIENVLPFSDGATDDGVINSIEDFLNDPVGGPALDLISVALDLGELQLFADEDFAIDLGELIVGDVIDDVRFGIRDIDLDGQLVFGIDSTSAAFYVQTPAEAVEGSVSELDLTFETFVEFSGKSIYGMDLLDFNNAVLKVTPIIEFNQAELEELSDAMGRLRLGELSSVASAAVITVTDEELVRFSADEVRMQTLIGVFDSVDTTPTDDQPAVSATINLLDSQITGTIDRLTGEPITGGPEIQIDGIDFAFGPDMSPDVAILRSDNASATYQAFDQQEVTLSVEGLTVQRAGRITATRMSAEAGSDDNGGLIASTGLGGIFPFEVTGISIEGPAAEGDESTLQPFDVGNLTSTLVGGESEPVDISIVGYFDLSIYDNNRLNPSLRIGGQPQTSGPDHPVELVFTYHNDKFAPKDISPIAMELDSEIAPGMELRGELVLGGYQDGVWNSSIGGSLTATLDADEDRGELAVAILPGSTLDVSTGVLDLRGEVTLEAGISGEIGGFAFDGGVLPFQMLLDVDVTGGVSSFNRFDVRFGELKVERLSFQINDFITLVASDITFDAVPGDGPAATVGELDVLFSSTSIFAGMEATIEASDVALFADRFEVSQLGLELEGRLASGNVDLLAVDDLRVDLHNLVIPFPSLSELHDSETVSTGLDTASVGSSRVDVSLSAGVLFPSGDGPIEELDGMARVFGLAGSIVGGVGGKPQLEAGIDEVELQFGGDDLSVSANDVSFSLGDKTVSTLLSVDRATLQWMAVDGRPIEFFVDNLRATHGGVWTIEGGGFEAGAGLFNSFGLAGILPIDVTGGSIASASDEVIMLLAPAGMAIPDLLMSIDVTVDLEVFDALPFEPVVSIESETLTFVASGMDVGRPRVRIEDTGLITLGIRDYAVGPFAVDEATITLGGYVDGVWQPNIDANVDLSFDSQSFDAGVGIEIDEDTSFLNLPNLTDDPSLPDLASLRLDSIITGSVRVGSFAAEVPTPGPGFELEQLRIPLVIQLDVQTDQDGPRLVALDDQPFIRLGDSSVTADAVRMQLGELFRFEATGVELDFGVFRTDATGNFIATDGPFITFGGNAPERVEPDEDDDEFLPTLLGGDGELSVTLGDPNDSTNPLAGFGGSAGNFGIGFDPDSPLQLSLVPLPGMFVSLSAPDDFNFGLPEAIPLRLTELGIRLPDNLGSLMPVGGLENLEQVGSFGLDVLGNSMLMVSGGIDSVDGGWPIRGLVEDMEIDLAAMRRWAELVTDPTRSSELSPAIRDRVADLVADDRVLEAIGLIGTDLFSRIDIGPVIANIDAVDFGIDGFELGPLTIGGGLGFGVLDIDSDDDGIDDKSSLFGRVSGELVYDGIGVGVELVITEYGPVLGRVLAGAPIPVGSLVGALIGSAAPGPGTAAGAAIGAASGFVISGLQGGLVFDGNPLPQINEPIEILSVEEIQTPLDVSLADIKASVQASANSGNLTWDNGFKLIGTGMLTNIYAAGVANLSGTFGVNVGQITGANDADDGPSDENPFGVQLYGLGSLNVMGQALAQTGVLLDFADPINPVLDMAAALPGQGNLLSLLVPIDGEIGVRLETTGIAEGVVIAVGQMIEQIVDETGDELRGLFVDLADQLNRTREALLVDYLLDGQDRDTLIDVDFLIGRLQELIVGAREAILSGAREGSEQAIQDAIQTSAEVFRNLFGLYSDSVGEVQRLATAFRDGLVEAREVIHDVVANLNAAGDAQTRVLRDLLRNLDLTRVDLGGDGAVQGLDDNETDFVITPEHLFETLDQWITEAKSAAERNPWIDVGLVEFASSEFVDLVRQVNPTLVAGNLFDSLTEHPVLGSIAQGISSQFENLATFSDPFAQPARFAAAKAFSTSRAALERQFQLATAIGTILTDAGASGLNTFFDVIDPSLQISGQIQPVLFGVPVGEPTEQIEVSIDKNELRFSGTFKVLEKMQLLLQQPLPIQDRIDVDVTLPFENLFRDLALGGVPEVDPLQDAHAVLQGTATLYGLFDLGDVTGIAFAPIPDGQPVPEDHPLATRVEIIDQSSDVGDIDRVLVTQAEFDQIRSTGGVLLDGRLTLPLAVTDPFAWFGQLRTIGTDAIESCETDSALDCFIDDPVIFMNAAGQAMHVLGAERQIAQVQLFVPSFAEKLGDLIDVDDPEATVDVFRRAIDDPAALLELADQNAINALFEKIFVETYLRGDIGSSEDGSLQTTSKILGIDLGGASVRYADPNPDDAIDERSLLISGRLPGGLDGKFEFVGLDRTYPAIGGEIAVGSFAQNAGEPLLDQFAALLRDNPITGSSDELADVANWFFGQPGQSTETHNGFGARLRAYTPGFDTNPGAVAIRRLGGVEVAARLGWDNPIGNLRGQVDFAVAPGRDGVITSGAFTGYGQLTLGGLINVDLGSADEPAVVGELTEDGLLSIEMSAELFEDSELIDLSTGGSARWLIDLAGGDISLSIDGRLRLNGFTIEGSADFVVDGNSLSLSVDGTSTVIGQTPRIRGTLSVVDGRFASGSLFAALPQIGPDDLNISGANVRIIANDGELSATVGGARNRNGYTPMHFNLPTERSIELPTLTLSADFGSIVPTSLGWDLDLGPAFEAVGSRLEAFGLSFDGDLLRLNRSGAPIPLVTLPGSNVELEDLLIQTRLSDSTSTQLAATVSGTLAAGGDTLAATRFSVTLDQGVFEFTTIDPTQLDLGFLSLELSGFVRSDGGFGLFGETDFDVDLLGVSLEGEFTTSLTNAGFASEFTGSVQVAGAAIIHGEGSLTRQGCLSLGGQVFALAPGACSGVPRIRIDDASVVEGGFVDGRAQQTIMTFTVSLSRPLGPADPFIVQVPVMLESDTGVPETRRASIGNDAPFKLVTRSGNVVEVSGDDVRDLISPLVTFTRGQAQATVSVTIFGDSLLETDERFRVRLGQPVGFGAQGPSPYGVLEKSVGIGTIRNDDAISVFVVGIVQNGYIDGATVGLDANFNGRIDEDEPSTTSDAGGRFALPYVATLDGNGNGVYDDAEGNLIAIGGMDISTRQPSVSVLRAPGGSESVTPITTLLITLVEDLDLPPVDAQRLLADALNLSSQSLTRDADWIGRVVDGDEVAARASVANVLINTHAAVLSRIFVAGGANDALATSSAYLLLAEDLIASGDLSATLEANSVVQRIRRAIARSDIAMDPVGTEALIDAALLELSSFNQYAAAVGEVDVRHAKSIQRQIGERTLRDIDRLLSGDLTAQQFRDDHSAAFVALDDIALLQAAVIRIADSQPIDLSRVDRSDTVHVKFPLTLSRVSDRPVTVEYQWIAEASGDAELTGSVVIEAGQTEAVIAIPVRVRDLNAFEPEHRLVLVEADGGVIGDVTGLLSLHASGVTFDLTLSGDDGPSSIFNVVATDRRDQVDFRYVDDRDVVQLIVDGRFIGETAVSDLQLIHVNAGAGADFVRVLGALPVKVHFDGGDGNDYMRGGSGADVLIGGMGRNYLVGRDGDDWLLGGEGHDYLFGGNGNDLIQGGDGNDYLAGGAGDDDLAGNTGRDALFGQSGNDRVQGGPGTDHLYGGAGNDRLFGGDGHDRIFASLGDDIAEGNAGDDYIDGGAGHDRLSGGPGRDRINGRGGDDSLFGGAGHDILDGRGGDDSLFGGAGHDILNGRDGDDSLLGGAGHDILRGGFGDDSLNGGQGNDHLFGHAGDDVLYGNHASDRIHPGPGNDVIVDLAALPSVGANDPVGSDLQNGTQPIPMNDLPLASVDRDTNWDGLVTPLDALLVINHLNRVVSKDVAGTSRPSDELDSLDVNRDGHVTPLDALLIINQINRATIMPFRIGEDLSQIIDGQVQDLALAKLAKLEGLGPLEEDWIDLTKPSTI